MHVALTMLLVAVLASSPAAQAEPRTDELATLINRARSERGLPTLTRNAQLDAAATVHSRDMVAHNYLDHPGSDGSTPQERAERAGYRIPDAGGLLVVEVISAISAEPSGPLNWWLNESPEVHGKVLTDPRWRDMGVGYAAGGEYGNYWTVLVARDPTAPAEAVRPTPSLSVASNASISGSDIEVRWSGLTQPNERDWLGLYRPDSPDDTYLTWVYVSCAQAPLQARANGWCWLRLPEQLPSGTYELRLHTAEGEQSTQVAVDRVEAAGSPELFWR